MSDTPYLLLIFVGSFLGAIIISEGGTLVTAISALLDRLAQ